MPLAVASWYQGRSTQLYSRPLTTSFASPSSLWLLHETDEQSTGVFHRTSPWAPPQAPAAYQQDLDTAEELLAAAGWTDTDDDGVLDGYAFLDPEFDGQINEVKRVKFEFTIVTSNRLYCSRKSASTLPNRAGTLCSDQLRFSRLTGLARLNHRSPRLGESRTSSSQAADHQIP